MAYSELYYHEYTDIGGTVIRTEIHEKDYSGGVTAIDYADGLPNRLRHGGSRDSMEEDIIQGQELIFAFWVHRDDIAVFDSLFESDYMDYMIIQKAGGNEVFRGWLKPENLSKEYFENLSHIHISLSATDGLAELKKMDFLDSDGKIISGRYSFLEIIKYALTPIENELDFYIQLGTYDKDNMASTDCALDKTGCDAHNFIKSTSSGAQEVMSCWDVIKACLKNFNCTLKQLDGNYQITNQHEINTYEFKFDWDTLTQQSRLSRNRSLNIQEYEFGKSIDQQKIRPLKTVELTFHTRDLGGDATGVDLSDLNNWNSDWDNELEMGDGSFRFWQNSADTYQGNYIELDNDFAVVKVTDNDYLTMSFDLKVVQNSGDRIYPRMKISMSVGGVYGWPIRSFQPYFDHWQHIDLGIRPGAKVQANGDYNFRLTFGHAGNDGDYEIYINNIRINKVINPAEGELSSDTEVTLDRLFRQSHDKNQDKYGTETILADGAQATEVGSILYNNATLTELWNSYGYSENIPLADIYARNVLNNRYRFKNFLRRVVINDRDNNIHFDQVLVFDSRYYVFASYERDFRNCQIIGDLIELL